MEYDIRRQLRINGPVTGAQLVEALKQYAEQTHGQYAEVPADDDEKRIIGIYSKMLNRRIMIRTGEGLDNTAISEDETYSQVGVGTTDQFIGSLAPRLYHEHDFVKGVEDARDGLERLLQKS